MSLKSKLSKFVKHPALKGFCIVAVLLVFFLLIVDSIVMPVIAGRYADKAEVPNVIALTEEQAMQALTAVGFGVEWSSEPRYSSEVPEGNVLGQTPEAGRVAKVGRTVILTKSKGLREVEIPDMRGKSQKQATMFITRAGLVEGKVIKGAHVSIPRGVVIRTVPAAGSLVRVGDTVSVVISAGEKAGKELLPNYTDAPFDSVKTVIEKSGFKIGEVKFDSIPERVSGQVVSQVPRGGEYLPKGTVVDFIVVK